MSSGETPTRAASPIRVAGADPLASHQTSRHILRRATAEALGTGLLLTAVVGSGIAAQRLSSDAGLQLLENSIATGLALGVLILLLGPVSGAHFNPAVSAADAILGRRTRSGLSLAVLSLYLVAQVGGAIGGTLLAHAMFAVPAGISTTARATPATVVAEVVATAGLVLLVVGLSRTGRTIPTIAVAVGAYIAAAYWFTSSTSFANPAVTVARMFTDTFAGIAPASVPPFLLAQLVGAATGIALALVLFPTPLFSTPHGATSDDAADDAAAARSDVPPPRRGMRDGARELPPA